MAEEPVREVIRRLYDEVLNRGDMEVLNEIVSEDLIENQAGPPGSPTGREGFREWLTTFRRAFPDLHFDIKDMIIDKNKAWVRSTGYGTNTGEFLGLPATGKTIAAEAIDIFRIENGQQVEHWGVFDQYAIMQQLGLVQSAGEQGK
ncbi:MAG: ester cyclase [Chloroflexi bacterium]|nr:MAG: ester cyclase [Chloroflexota bacterium]